MILIGLALASAEAGPAKLVLTYGTDALQVISYTSFRRCEDALIVIEADANKRKREARESLPPGAIQVSGPYTIKGVCIPG